MKKVLPILLAIVVLSTTTYAADPKPLTKAGDAALVFDLGGLANLAAGNYQGGLGFKYYLMRNFALRAGVGFTTNSTTTKNATSPTPANQIGESKLSETSFTVAPGIQVNLAQSNAVVAYIGGQVSFTTSTRSREGNTDFGVGFAKDTKIETTSTAFGAAGFVGVEWFAWENISLAGEYRIGFNTSTGKTTVTLPAPAKAVETDAPSVTGFGIASGNAAALTVSVFF